jgi:hypothetical protein
MGRRNVQDIEPQRYRLLGRVMSDPQHNFRMRHSGGWSYFSTQEAIEKEIGLRTDTPLAEFYQPGIGWVRYTPEPKPKPLSQQLRSLALEMERLAGEVRNLDVEVAKLKAVEMFGAAKITKGWADWIKEKYE